MRGELKAVASYDLQGLGTTDGPAITRVWTPPNLMPEILGGLLPWLAVLTLLMLKPNRTALAWWVWLPLVCVAMGETLARARGFMPWHVLEFFGQAFNSVGFGLAAVWLLAPYLGHRLRLVTFLKMLAAIAGMSAFAHLARQDWEEMGLSFVFLISLGACILVTVFGLSLTWRVCRPHYRRLAAIFWYAAFLVALWFQDWSELEQAFDPLFYVGLCVLVAATGLSVAGWICRRRYQPLVLTLWVAVFITAFWNVISAPSLVAALVSKRGGVPWMGFFQEILPSAALTFGVILPFLVLSFTNRFYRERLKQLLRLESSSVPPVLTLTPTPTPAP